MRAHNVPSLELPVEAVAGGKPAFKPLAAIGAFKVVTDHFISLVRFLAVEDRPGPRSINPLQKC